MEKTLHPLLNTVGKIKGIGIKIASKLAENNIYSIADLLKTVPATVTDIQLVDYLTNENIVSYIILAVQVMIREIIPASGKVLYICEDQAKNRIQVIMQKYSPYLKIGTYWIISGHFIVNLSNPGTFYSSHPIWYNRNLWKPNSLLYKIKKITNQKFKTLLKEAISYIQQFNFKNEQIIQYLIALHDDTNPTIQLLNKITEKIAESECKVIRYLSVNLIENIKSKQFTALSDLNILEPIKKRLPYKITEEQLKALNEIIDDFQLDIPMSRLLQGDAGAGKTIVALLAAEYINNRGLQVALMAPTTVLAKQHYETAKRIMSHPVYLVTGQVKDREFLNTSKPSLFIGTHALLYTELPKNLGFVIIDEQHKFGVEQRLKIRAQQIHALSMSATPIPRSLYLTSLGYLASSKIINSLPGRSPIITEILPLDRILSIKVEIEAVLAENKLVYWVCPRIIDNPIQNIASIEERHIELEKLFPGKITVMHGQTKDKDQVIKDFQSGLKPILLSTTVIEVGIDVSTAKLMIIEQGERFGLAQLHQLRGRVGRAQNMQSKCLILHKPNAKPLEIERLNILKSNENGFLVAEADQKYRGSGSIFGNEQTGKYNFQFFNPTIHNIDENKINETPGEIELLLWDKDNKRIYAV